MSVSSERMQRVYAANIFNGPVVYYRQHDKANHCRIKSKLVDGRPKFCLVENLVFDSLYELIDFYKQNRLRSQNFELCLREPVPKVPSPRGKE